MERNSVETLQEKEYECIKSKLSNLPEDPYAKIFAIAQAISDLGIREDRFDTVFNEVYRRL